MIFGIFKIYTIHDMMTSIQNFHYSTMIDNSIPNEAITQFLSSVKKRQLLNGIESLLHFHPKRKFKYPSEERKKYSTLHQWYNERMKNIQQQLKTNQVNSEEVVREKLELLILTMRQYSYLAYQECEEKGLLIDVLATHQLEFNNILIKELDSLLKQNIQQRVIDNKNIQFEYEDKIRQMEDELREIASEKQNKWKSMFLLIKDNRVLRRAKGKLTRAFSEAINREKRLQEEILEIRRENEKLKVILDLEDDINMHKIVSNMVSLNTLEKCIKKFPTKAKKVLDFQLENLEINELENLPNKIQYIVKAINEAEEIVDYYEDLHELINPPKLLLNAFTQTEQEREEKWTNTPQLLAQINNYCQVKKAELAQLSLDSYVFWEQIFPHIPKGKRNYSVKSSNEKRFTKTNYNLTQIYHQTSRHSNSNEKTRENKIQHVLNEKIELSDCLSVKRNTNEKRRKSSFFIDKKKIVSVYSFCIHRENFKSSQLVPPTLQKGEKIKRKSFEKDSYKKRITLTEESEFKMKSIIEERSESSENNIGSDEETVTKRKSTRKRKTMDKVKPAKQSFVKVKENLEEPLEESSEYLKEKGKEKEKENPINLVKTMKNEKKVGKYRASGMNYLLSKKSIVNEIPSENTITQTNELKSSSNDIEPFEGRNEDFSQKKKMKKVSTRISITHDLKGKLKNPNHRLSSQRQFIPINTRKEIKRSSSHNKQSGFVPGSQREKRESNESQKKRSGSFQKGFHYYPHLNSTYDIAIKSFQINKLVQKIIHALFLKRKEVHTFTTLPNFIYSYLKVFYGNNYQSQISSFFRSISTEVDPSPPVLAFIRMLNINVPWIYLKDLLRIYLLLFEKASRENLVVEKEMGEKIIDFVFSIFYKLEQKAEYLANIQFIEGKSIDLNQFFIGIEYALYRHSFQTEFSLFCREIFHQTQSNLTYSQLLQLTQFLKNNVDLSLHLARIKCFCLLNSEGDDNSFPIHKISLYTVRQNWKQLMNIKKTINSQYQKIFKSSSSEDLMNFMNKRFLLVKEDCPWLLRLGRFHVKNYYRYNIKIDFTILKLLRLTEVALQMRKMMPIPSSYQLISEKFKKLMIKKQIQTFKHGKQLE